MTLIEVVILAGVQCLSPLEAAEKTTIAGKVPCAVLIRLDQETGDVDFTPAAAASNPEVIAMLVKPGGPEDEPTGTTTAAPPVAEGDAPDPLPPAAAAPPKPKVKKQAERVRAAAVSKKQRTARRKDACGSYRAVWYTSKGGHKRYRCVRTG